MNAAAFRPLIVAYRDGRPVRLDEVANVYDGVENDKQASWFNDARTIYLAINRQPGTNTVEIVDSIRALLPQIQSAAARRARRWRSAATGRSRFASRCTTSSSRCSLHGRPRRAGHLPLPAQSLGDDHPQPRAAGVDRRHVRRDVPAGLQPRQPVADGAHARGRLRRGRRDRHAREHRAPHGARRESR